MWTASGLGFEDAVAWDVNTVAGLLAETSASSTLGRWLNPGPVCRVLLFDRLRMLTSTVLQQGGVVRLVTDGREVVAAAIWLSCASQADLSLLTSSLPAPNSDGFDMRAYLLGQKVTAVHPASPHDHLICLGVVPARQGQGIGALMITDPHARPRGGGPRFLTAIDQRSRALFTRCGYRDSGPPITFQDPTVQLWPMLSTPDSRPGLGRRGNQVWHRFKRAASRLTESDPAHEDR